MNTLEKYGSQVRVHSVELQINDLSGKYFLPDDAILRNQTIIGLSIPTPAIDESSATGYIVQNSPETDRPLIVPDAFYNAYIFFLDSSNTELLFGVPFSQYAIEMGDKSLTPIYMEGFTPSKSYIQIGDPTAAGRLTVGQSIYLNFYYLGASSNTRY